MAPRAIPLFREAPCPLQGVPSDRQDELASRGLALFRLLLRLSDLVSLLHARGLRLALQLLALGDRLLLFFLQLLRRGLPGRVSAGMGGSTAGVATAGVRGSSTRIRGPTGVRRPATVVVGRRV